MWLSPPFPDIPTVSAPEQLCASIRRSVLSPFDILQRSPAVVLVHRTTLLVQHRPD